MRKMDGNFICRFFLQGRFCRAIQTLKTQAWNLKPDIINILYLTPFLIQCCPIFFNLVKMRKAALKNRFDGFVTNEGLNLFENKRIKNFC